MTDFSKLRRFLWVGFFKTIYINFKLLPFHQALKLPFLVTSRVFFYSLKGKAVITGPVRAGMIRLGFLHSNFFHWKEHTILNIDGKIFFQGIMNLGVGSNIEVTKNAELKFGSNLQIGGRVKIICRRKIEIGDFFRSGWETQIFDTNFHYIRNIVTGEISERNTPVYIGRNNWLGNRSSIMAGTKTPDFTIIASYSLCNKDYLDIIERNSLIGGSPAKLIKSGLERVLEKEEKEIGELYTSGI